MRPPLKVPDGPARILECRIDDAPADPIPAFRPGSWNVNSAPYLGQPAGHVLLLSVGNFWVYRDDGRIRQDVTLRVAISETPWIDRVRRDDGAPPPMNEMDFGRLFPPETHRWDPAGP